MADNQNQAPVSPQIPSIQEMGTQVAQVPQTEPQPVPTNTQQPIPQQTNQIQQNQASGIQLANTPETDPDPVDATTEKVIDYLSIFKKYAVKTIGFLLTLQGIHGLYKSVMFILVEYPILEQQLVAHQISQAQVNDFGIKAIMMVISTVLSMFFAMKLTFLKTKAAKTVSTVIGILLFIGNAMIHDYFASLNSSQILVDYILSVVYFFQGAPEQVIENTPYLEETVEGTIDTVWYK